jgi:murein endopeptidase
MPLPTGDRASLHGSRHSQQQGYEGQGGFLQLRDHTGAIRQVKWVKRSESLGKPNDGTLTGGVLFPMQGPGWIRKKGPAYGTDETLRLLDWAFQEVRSIYPGSAPIVVGDISGQWGGPLKKHNSHQSGRDVDIGYFAADNEPLREFRKLTADTMDVEKTWALVERFLVTGYVRFIFISYVLQEPLYEEALACGWSPEELERIFQYPRGHRTRKGIIRHAKGHQDHFHLRFKCPASDAQCVP